MPHRPPRSASLVQLQQQRSRPGEKERARLLATQPVVANLLNKILGSRGFYSSRVLILRGGILISIWNFPEVSSQRS